MNTKDFMNYAGYRNMVIEEMIEKCLAQLQNGVTEITIDRGDLTDSEAEYLKREVARRAQRRPPRK